MRAPRTTRGPRRGMGLPAAAAGVTARVARPAGAGAGRNAALEDGRAATAVEPDPRSDVGPAGRTTTGGFARGTPGPAAMAAAPAGAIVGFAAACTRAVRRAGSGSAGAVTSARTTPC